MPDRKYMLEKRRRHNMRLVINYGVFFNSHKEAVEYILGCWPVEDYKDPESRSQFHIKGSYGQIIVIRPLVYGGLG